MRQESITRPPQMRDGGLLPAHLPSSMATPLDPPRWLAPPPCTPEPHTPVPASDVTTIVLARFNAIINERMISMNRQFLAQSAKLTLQAQWVETAQSTTLATWQHQEDAAHAQALAEEADMQHHHDDTLSMITEGFPINLSNLAVEVASWDGTDEAMALLAMVQCNNAVNTQPFHKELAATAAKAPQKAAVRATALAVSRSQEDDMHTQALTTAAAKRGRSEARNRTNMQKHAHLLGFGSYDDYIAWRAGCKALADDEVGAPKQASSLGEKTSVTDMESAGHPRDSPPGDMTATAFSKETRHPVTDDTTPRRAVAKRNTQGVFPTSGDNPSAPGMMPLAPPTAVSSTPPRPTICGRGPI
jgi:hypothetical protein